MKIENLGGKTLSVPLPVWAAFEAAAYLTHGPPAGLREFWAGGEKVFGLFSSREKAEAAAAAVGYTGSMGAELADPAALRDYLIYFENRGGRHVGYDLGGPAQGPGTLLSVASVIAELSKLCPPQP